MMTDEERERLAQAYEQVRRDLGAFFHNLAESVERVAPQIGDAVRAALPETTKEPAHPE